MSGLTRDGTAEPVSRDQILSRELGQKKKTSCRSQRQSVEAGRAQDRKSRYTKTVIAICLELPSEYIWITGKV